MVKYRVIKERYSREEIEILKRKKTNLKFNPRDRWGYHFKDNAKFNDNLSKTIEERIPTRKITSNPLMLNGSDEKSFYSQ